MPAVAVVCPRFHRPQGAAQQHQAELSPPRSPAARHPRCRSSRYGPAPLDEPRLADRLVHRAADIRQSPRPSLGRSALGLKGERLAELGGLARAGCVAFSQANRPVVDTESLMRALECAAAAGYAVWLQPRDHWLARNIAHAGEVANRLGLAEFPSVPDHRHRDPWLLARDTGVRLHLTRLSSGPAPVCWKSRAAGVTSHWRRQHPSPHLTENDIGYFDSPRPASTRRSARQKRSSGAFDAAARGVLRHCSDHTPQAPTISSTLRRPNPAPPASNFCCP